MITRMSLNETEKIDLRRIIYSETGYTFNSSSILNQVFRRSSFAAENGQSSNEIFEFIGDQVLSFYVVKIITERCGSLSLLGDYTFRISEKQFTRIKQALVNNETLAKIIDEWDIAKYLLLGKSDIKNEVVKESKVKADLLEAIIGAIAVDSNWDSNTLQVAVSKALKTDEILNDIIESDPKVKHIDINNAVTSLKELAEKGQCTMPKYELVGPEHIGYDSDGNPKWACRCVVINDKIGIGKLIYSTSKKDAKKAAAYLVLCEHLDMQNKYGPKEGYPMRTHKNGKGIYKKSRH